MLYLFVSACLFQKNGTHFCATRTRNKRFYISLKRKTLLKLYSREENLRGKTFSREDWPTPIRVLWIGVGFFMVRPVNFQIVSI